MPYCPRCRSEYRAGFTRCADCGLDLVDELPEEIREEVPEEEAFKKPESRGEWLSRLVPREVDPVTTARCIKLLCWLLVAVALYSLLYHTVISLEYYYEIQVWEHGDPVFYVGWLFFTLFGFEHLLLIILALFLSASMMTSHNALMLRLMLYFSLLMVIWHSTGLVFFIITAVKNDIWSNTTTGVAFVTGVFVFTMIILIGVVSTLLSRRLKMTVATEGV